MQLLIEVNLNATNGMNEFNDATADQIAARNRKLQSEGKVPSWIVIGEAASPAEAGTVRDAYRAARATRS